MIRSRWFGLFLLFVTLTLVTFVGGPVVQGEDPPDVLTIDPTEFGISFINSAETPRDGTRIQRGLEAGAQLDRFPFYWDRIEVSPGEFDWSKQDAALRTNEEQGLGTLAILLGTASQYWWGSEFVSFSAKIPNVEEKLRDMLTKGEKVARSCSRESIPPAGGLYHPIFADGSDEPAADKRINPENPWARFVAQAVERYRPGGTEGRHVRYWEIWNEPDLCHFWRGTALDYARLLKVAYLTIKHIDPEATVLWGGLALYGPKYEGGANFLHEFVTALKNDPLAASHNGFFDAAAVHQYSNVMHSYNNARRVQKALAKTGWENKPIWVTESGVPICDAFPGPSCDVTYHRASPKEQAAYIWQNIAYTRVATWPNIGPIFHFQLYDDAGNECKRAGPADGFGLITNEPDSPCVPHHAEARLGYTAYQLATQYFSGAELLWNDIQDGLVRRVAFYHPEMKERRTLVWALDGRDAVASVPATTKSAELITVDGSTESVTAVDDVYQIALPGATNQNQPDDPTYTIGGQPYLLIEGDSQPPTGIIKELPPISPLSFTVEWEVSDLGSGLKPNSVTIWSYAQKNNEGEWEAWLTEQPATGRATFSGEAGVRYYFAVLAGDRAGNNGTTVKTVEETVVKDDTTVDTLEELVAKDDTTVETVEEPEAKDNTSVKTVEEPVAKDDTTVDRLEEPVAKDDTTVKTVEEPVAKDDTLLARVSGYVQNTRQQPASWAKVSIADATAIANEEGYFALDVPLGEWDVLVEDKKQKRAQLFFDDSDLYLMLEPNNNPVVNGSFENDLSGWEISGSSPLRQEEMPDSQDHALRLASAFVADANVPGADGPGTGGNSTISQRLTVPADNPVLSLAYQVNSTETDGGNGSCADRDNILHDRFEIIIAKDGEPANYILCQDTASEWRYDSFDLSDYAGEEIRLILNIYETSANNRSNALIDQVVIGESPLLAQPEFTPTPIPTKTATPAPKSTQRLYYLPLMLSR